MVETARDAGGFCQRQGPAVGGKGPLSPWTTIYTEVVISRVRSKFELARYSEFVDGFGPLFSNQPRLNGRREGGTAARHV